MTLYKKLQIKLSRGWRGVWKFNESKPTGIQLKAIAITRMALKRFDADLMIMPTSDKRIIKLEKDQLFIVLSKNIIEITNHTFNYHIELNYDIYNKTVREFDQKLDKRVQEQEQTRLGQLEVGLDSLIKTMT